MRLKLTAYGLSELKRRNPPIAERGTHKIRLSENMSQQDLQLLKGPEGHKSAWVEEVGDNKTVIPPVTEAKAQIKKSDGTK